MSNPISGAGSRQTSLPNFGPCASWKAATRKAHVGDMCAHALLGCALYTKPQDHGAHSEAEKQSL